MQDFDTFGYAQDSNTAREIYNEVMRKPANRFLMVWYAQKGKASLSAVVDEVEKLCAAPGADFDLTEEGNRIIVGRMVGAAMKPLGYGMTEEVPVESEHSTHFVTAARFQKVDGATEKLKVICE